MSQNLSSAAVVIGALRVNHNNYDLGNLWSKLSRRWFSACGPNAYEKRRQTKSSKMRLNDRFPRTFHHAEPQ